MAEILALKIGLSTPLSNGGKVFGVLSEDGGCTCFDLTAPDGIQTRFALSDEALSAMVDVALKLRERQTGDAVFAPAAVAASPPPRDSGKDAK
jgi:hypothetical protein